MNLFLKDMIRVFSHGIYQLVNLFNIQLKIICNIQSISYQIVNLPYCF